ncbi:hypothetical protein PAP_04425 [Palaeococcus pacificus DY20341]|uniref:KaiC-like domain-containing protein n=1 Tax=Palaeococcus pacificus DY20341 TaxID=1343739 RepID=A0A075LT47_9EURY|nr:hypothetical protein [Palaeococcus pacificus]AIF69296.1 hypothetical protein PAP_04425 [Palaeococcus pacificus DY20341]
MEIELISSGIKEIDELLGGGIVNNGILLIDYGKLSIGWTLGLKIFKHIIKNGGFGVILNTTIPISKLKLRANYVWLDIEKEGNAGNLIVIDLFGSKYKLPNHEPYVYQVKSWDNEIGLQKLGKLMGKIYANMVPKDRVVVSLIATMEGMYYNFGERFTNALIQGTLKGSELGLAKKHKTVQMLLLNRDAVDRKFETLLTILSDQVIMVDREPAKERLVEVITVPKSTIPGFIPKVKSHKIKEL